MRRESRQHGLVRTHSILPSLNSKSNSRLLNKQLKDPATAGVLTRAPSKPTNHSKFTGKCCRTLTCTSCNLRPAQKTTAKGAKKFGPTADVFEDYVTGPRLASRRTSAAASDDESSQDDGNERLILIAYEGKEMEGYCSRKNDDEYYYADWLLVE